MTLPSQPVTLDDLIQWVAGAADDEARLHAERQRLLGSPSPLPWLALCQGSVKAGERMDWWPEQRTRLAPLLSTAFAAPEQRYANLWTLLSLDCTRVLCDAQANTPEINHSTLCQRAAGAAVKRGLNPAAGWALAEVLQSSGVAENCGTAAAPRLSLPVALVDPHRHGAGHLADLTLAVGLSAFELGTEEGGQEGGAEVGGWPVGLYPAPDCAFVSVHADFVTSLEQAWKHATACHPVLAAHSVCWALRLRSGAVPRELAGQSAGAAFAAGLIALGRALAQVKGNADKGALWGVPPVSDSAPGRA